jgi:hypothetical protein
LAVIRHKGVEIDYRGYPVTNLLDGPGNRPAAIGMSDQADAGKVLPFDHIDDIRDVGVEDDILAHQVRSFAQPGHGGREHSVPLLLQDAGYAAPAPAAVPGTVNENEDFRRADLRHCWPSFQGERRPNAERCAREHAAASH